MNAIETLCIEIANLHLLADRLASRNHSEAPNSSLVEVADAMRREVMDFCTAAVNGLNSLRGIDGLIQVRIAYDAARSRHASGAQPSGAPAPASAHAITTQPNAPTMTPRETPVVYDSPASAQGEVCFLWRKKPVVIQAHRIGIDPWPDAAWQAVTENKIVLHGIDKPNGYIDIVTLEGTMRGEYGDWLIRGVKGEFYPCKPDIFALTYEPVE